jgi:superfamily II DNA or RNA helicase
MGKAFLGLALGLEVGQFKDADEPGRVAFLAHTRELTDQPYYSLDRIAPYLSGKRYGRAPAAGIVRANRNQANSRFLFATMQTLAGREGARLEEVLSHGAFDLVILDEAHHAAARSYADIIVPKFLDANPNTKILGLTATPARSDGKALDSIFDDISYQMNLRDGIRGGWLKDLTAETVKTKVDISQVARRENDFVLKQLQAALRVANWTEVVGKAYMERNGHDRYAISFMPSVDMGRELCEWLRDQGVKAASVDSQMVIDGDGKITEAGNSAYWKARDYVLDAYRGGDYRVLGGYSVLLEGFDAPNTDMILQGRPTDSQVLLTQLIGRGLRTPDGVARIIPDKERDIFRVQRDGDDEKWYEYPKNNMPFAHNCHVLDFTLKDTSLLLAGSLAGNYIEEVDVEETEIIKVEPLPNDFELMLKKGKGREYSERNFFRMSGDNWCFWPDGTHSAYLGANKYTDNTYKASALFVYPRQKMMVTRMGVVLEILERCLEQGLYPEESLNQLIDTAYSYYRAFGMFMLFQLTDIPVSVSQKGNYKNEFVRWNSKKVKIQPLGVYPDHHTSWEVALPISQELSSGGFFVDKNRPGAKNAASSKALDLMFKETYSNGRPNIFYTMPTAINDLLGQTPGLELFRIEKPTRKSLVGETSIRVSGMVNHIGIYSLILAHGLGLQLINAQSLYNTWNDIWRTVTQSNQE